MKKWIALVLVLVIEYMNLSEIKMEYISKSKAAEKNYDLSNPRLVGNSPTWDCVYFGNYWQEDTNGDGVADEKDDKQPIRWRVLSVDGDDAFLISDKVLLCSSPTNSKGGELVTWENSNIRKLLNGTFLSQAFSAEESDAIYSTIVENNVHPYFKTTCGKNTVDKVYCLSYEEAVDAKYELYGFNSNDTRGLSRNADVTTYAYGGKELSSYWLRTTGREATYYYRQWLGIKIDSGRLHGVAQWNDKTGVRPVLHLNLAKKNLWKKAGTVSAGRLQQNNISEIESPMVVNDIPIWHCIYFGSYWQTDTNNDGRADTKDEKEPIKWRILSKEDNVVYLISDKALDYRQLEENYSGWSTSEIRNWLNQEFCSAAFSNQQLKSIKEAATEQNTKDNISLLQCDDDTFFTSGFNAIKEGLVGKNLEGIENIAYNTDFARQKSNSEKANWLVGKGAETFCDSNGYYTKLAQSDGVRGAYSIRPTLTLDLTDKENWSYAGIVDGAGNVKEKEDEIIKTPVPTSTPNIAPDSMQTENPKNTSTPRPNGLKQGMKIKLPNSKKNVTSFMKGNIKYKKIGKSKNVKVEGVKSKKLVSVVIPNKVSFQGKTYVVSTVGNGAFKNCKKLLSIQFKSKSLKSIGKYAFQNCKKLNIIWLKNSKKIKSVGKKCLKGIPKGQCTIKVPKAKLKIYGKLFKNKG